VHLFIILASGIAKSHSRPNYARVDPSSFSNPATKVIKPRWLHPQNFRGEDREILQAALDIAERDKTDLTGIIRTALAEYVKKAQQRPGKNSKLDEFLKDSQFVGENYREILS
jgi:hypothetical protein